MQKGGSCFFVPALRKQKGTSATRVVLLSRRERERSTNPKAKGVACSFPFIPLVCKARRGEHKPHFLLTLLERSCFFQSTSGLVLLSLRSTTRAAKRNPPVGGVASQTPLSRRERGAKQAPTVYSLWVLLSLSCFATRAKHGESREREHKSSTNPKGKKRLLSPWWCFAPIGNNLWFAKQGLRNSPVLISSGLLLLCLVLLTPYSFGLQSKERRKNPGEATLPTFPVLRTGCKAREGCGSALWARAAPGELRSFLVCEAKHTAALSPFPFGPGRGGNRTEQKERIRPAPKEKGELLRTESIKKAAREPRFK
jgi:hypothetical protein